VFREDLSHRFHKDITIPPLRERPEDILPLANYFIGELLRKEVVDRRLGLSPSGEQALTKYNFHGNVRLLAVTRRDKVNRVPLGDGID
jgi:transcriptional regulator with GAF, ATPase, and Fis domain